MSDSLSEKRSPDQDAAVEEAFVAGTLPEEDRRSPAPTVPVAAAPSVPPVIAEPDPLIALIAAAENETGYSQRQAFAALRKHLGVTP